MENPTSSLSRSKMASIISSRNMVISNLEKTSNSLGEGGRKILLRKLNSSASPPIGELIPWILKDLFNIPNSRVKAVAIGWLEIYLYTTLIDDLLDNKRVAEPDELLAGSLMFHDGVLRLSKMVAGTKYESVLKKSLHKAAEYQLLDVTENSNFNPSLKEKIAEGKNLILLACAVALASGPQKKQSRMIDFTKSIILGLQYLDDITDWEEDYKNGNFTKLLAIAHSRLERSSGGTLNINKSMPKNEVFAVLIKTGALSDLLKQTNEIITTSILMATSNNNISLTETHHFFNKLLELTNLAIQEVEAVRNIIEIPFSDNQISYLEKPELAIRKIAQSS